MDEPYSEDFDSSTSDCTRKDVQMFSDKHGFRLTPEEQELKYKLKAKMMRKLDEKKNNLKQELMAHQKLTQLKRQQVRATSARLGRDDKLSRINAVQLMRMYEKKSNQAEQKVKTLQSELEKADAVAARYKSLYIGQKSSSPRTTKSSDSRKQSATKKKNSENERKSESESDSKKSNEKIRKGKLPSDCLDDDEDTLFKRHVARIVETSSMVTSSPLKVEDIVRKNQSLMTENESLQRDMQRLRWDNTQLVKKVKESAQDRDQLLHHISTSEAARVDLMKRLEKQQRKHNSLNQSLSKQATDWIQAHREMKEMEDRLRFSMISSVSVNGVEGRASSCYGIRKIHTTKKKLPVEQVTAADYSSKHAARSQASE